MDDEELAGSAGGSSPTSVKTARVLNEAKRRGAPTTTRDKDNEGSVNKDVAAPINDSSGELSHDDEAQKVVLGAESL